MSPLGMNGGPIRSNAILPFAPVTIALATGVPGEQCDDGEHQRHRRGEAEGAFHRMPTHASPPVDRYLDDAAHAWIFHGPTGLTSKGC